MNTGQGGTNAENIMTMRTQPAGAGSANGDPVAGDAEIVVCETCRNAEGAAVGPLLADHLRAAVAADPALAGVGVRTFRCLMSCRRPCAVLVRSAGRMSYVLGDLAPDRAAADTLAAYAAAYRGTADGVVPFRLWPEGVKGRFVARMPPALGAGEPPQDAA